MNDDQRDKYPRLRDALTELNNVSAYKITDSGASVLVRYSGQAKPAHVFAQLNRARLLPKGFGLRVFQQQGIE